jgi:hypothetical protein
MRKLTSAELARLAQIPRGAGRSVILSDRETAKYRPLVMAGYAQLVMGGLALTSAGEAAVTAAYGPVREEVQS